MLPIVPRDLVQPIHNGIVADFDGEFAAFVETPGGEVDRANQGSDAVGEQHLAVKLQVLQLVDLDAHIVEDSQSSNALHELVTFQGVRRPRHHMYLHPAQCGPDKAFDDDRVLKPLVLHEQLVLRLVDESANPVPPGPWTPHELTLLARLEKLTMPIGIAAIDDFVDFSFSDRAYSVIARFREGVRRPVEAVDKGGLLVNDH